MKKGGDTTRRAGARTYRRPPEGQPRTGDPRPGMARGTAGAAPAPRLRDPGADPGLTNQPRSLASRRRSFGARMEICYPPRLLGAGPVSLNLEPGFSRRRRVSGNFRVLTKRLRRLLLRWIRSDSRSHPPAPPPSRGDPAANGPHPHFPILLMSTVNRLAPTNRSILGLAALGAASSATAAVVPGFSLTVSATNTGVFPNIDFTVLIPWDVDGDGGVDGTAMAGAGFFYNTSVSQFVSGAALSVSALFGGDSSNVTPLGLFDVMDASRSLVATISLFDYAVGTGSASGFNTTYFGAYGLSLIAPGVPTVVGFAFVPGAAGGATDIHYGIATLTWELSRSGASFSLTDVLWNDVPGQGIRGDGTAVPEPASATGLAALALGAAGLTRWRRQRVAA